MLEAADAGARAPVRGPARTVTVVVPTFREVENLPELLERLGAVRDGAGIDLDVLLMDDDSRDGSADLVCALGLPWARMIVRTRDRGLSQAVLDGLRVARGDVLVVMDADLSHPPEKIPALLAALEEGPDAVVGSRFAPGGSTDHDWGLFRRLNSRVAALLAAPLTSLADPMSGFFALRRSTFEAARGLSPVGYKIGLELLVKCGCRRVVEVPIHFADRRRGESKLSLREQLNYLKHLRRLYVFRYGTWSHLAQFLAVGGSGVVVNLALLTLFLRVGLAMRAAVALAILASMLWNFALNRRFSFSYARRGRVLPQLAGFVAACSVGGAVNYAVTAALWDAVRVKQAAALCGVLAGTLFNFVASRAVVFRTARGSGPAPPSRLPAPPSGSRAAVGLTLVTLALSILDAVHVGGARLSPDSYQYLSVAENLRERGAGATSLVHFDTERAHGRVPAPMTTFPLAYPLLIAWLGFSGLRPETIALVLSIASSVAVIPLLHLAAGRLRLAPPARLAALFGWAFSAQALTSATAIRAEAPFTAVSLAALTLLLPAAGRPAAAWSVAAAGLLVGAGYHLRYAGLLFAGAFHVLAGIELLRGRMRRAWVAGVALCDGVIAVGVARNLALTGTWEGGNTRAVHNPVWGVARKLAFSAGDMLLGASAWLKPPTSPLPGLLAAITVVAALLVVAGVARSCAADRCRALRAVEGWDRVALWIAAYAAGMCYLGVTSPISFGVRMFVPALPLGLLLLGALLTACANATPARALPHGAGALLLVLAIGYAGVNLASLARRVPAPPHEVVAAALALPTPAGEPLSRWIERAVRRDAVLLSVEGQATGYVLRRATVSTTGRAFSDLRWTEEATRAVMSRFRAEHLIVFPEALAGGGASPDEGFAARSTLDAPFLRELAAGRWPPWLELAASNERTLVFRRR
jgi:dolichol-phosphate mannosyltransferase